MGLSLIFYLQNSLGIQVYEQCCNEEQKQRFLPDLISLKKFTCFGLTEPEGGSDATSGMLTTARKVEGGYIVNGEKRWPGNATIADFTIVWAKNISDGNKIQGFVVEKGQKGHSARPIPNKATVRHV
jgi:alkylation response protein AidB-like acyl-CoA dehydrogenase